MLSELDGVSGMDDFVVLREFLIEEFVRVKDVWCKDYEEGYDMVELFEFEE